MVTQTGRGEGDGVSQPPHQMTVVAEPALEPLRAPGPARQSLAGRPASDPAAGEPPATGIEAGGQLGTGHEAGEPPAAEQSGPEAGTGARRSPGWWFHGLRGRRRPATVAPPVPSGPRPARYELDIAPNDPIVAYFQAAPGAVDVSSLALDSPALDQMREAGIVLAVPLVVSGDLIGLVLLGPRLSERGYSSDDRRLLDSLASYAAPALRMGQLAEAQQADARRRERIEQELVVAQLIQQQFLPKALPELPGFEITAFYRPARTVGGDFYDCIELPDGRAMLVVGDVTDKGVPAALVMASTHSLLRSVAPRLLSPGATLAHVNELLCGDIPAQMFVTCIALVLDPRTGELEYANAGHDLPYLRTADGVVELRASGMPLGLMPGMVYDEARTSMLPGDQVLLHSDGLAEAHDEKRKMFGFPRVAELAGRLANGQQLIDLCLAELAAFTGPDQEQEDDITLVTLQCTHRASWPARAGADEDVAAVDGDGAAVEGDAGPGGQAAAVAGQVTGAHIGTEAGR
jgi:serine phosphatase RsbU (regulator of sigma subunit)